MPYKTPRKTKKGWTLPKVKGGLHKSKSGVIIRFSSKAKAVRAGKHIITKQENDIR